MDSTTAAVIVAAIFGLVILGFFMVFRARGQAKIKGPFNTQLEVRGENQKLNIDTKPGVSVQDAVSRSGKLVAADETGRGTSVKKVDIFGDIEATSSPTEQPQIPK
jgi:hypothetical protein